MRIQGRRLEGQIVLVTGSTRGIGAAMATAFAAEGAAVVVTGRSAAAGKAVVSAIRARDGQATYVPLDVTDEASVSACVHRAVATYGWLTGLVNNAAWVQGRSQADGRVTDITLEGWEQVLRICLTGVFLTSKHAIPEIVKAGGGAVLNIASIAALVGHRGRDAYTAAKGGVVSLTRSMAVEYAADNVRVNCLCLGPTPTDGAPAPREDIRYGRPDEVAQVATLFLSPESVHLNGTVLPVDGGLSATSPYQPAR